MDRHSPLSGALVAIEPAPDEPAVVDLHWILTRRCSYSCSYCPPHRHDPHSVQGTGDQLVRGLDFVSELFTTNDVRLNLTGGEPTIHPAFSRFVDHAVTLGPIKDIRIVSNMGSADRIYSHLAALRGLGASIRIVSSFHREFADRDTFLRRVGLLAAGGVPTTVKLMLSDQQVDRAFMDALEGLGSSHRDLHCVAQSIRGSSAETRADRVISETLVPPSLLGEARELFAVGDDGEVTSFIGSDLSWVIDEHRNTFQGWTCDAGRRSLFVDSNGDVYSALCKPDPAALFNLFAEDRTFSRTAAAIVCPHNVCECASTVRIPKRRVTPDSRRTR